MKRRLSLSLSTAVLLALNGCASTISMRQLTPNNSPVIKLQRIEGTNSYYGEILTEATDWKIGGASLKQITQIMCNPAYERADIWEKPLERSGKGSTMIDLIQVKEGLSKDDFICEAKVHTNYAGPSGGTEIVRWVVSAAVIAGGEVGAAALWPANKFSVKNGAVADSSGSNAEATASPTLTNTNKVNTDVVGVKGDVKGGAGGNGYGGKGGDGGAGGDGGEVHIKFPRKGHGHDDNDDDGHGKYRSPASGGGFHGTLGGSRR